MFLTPHISARWISAQVLFLFVAINAAFYIGVAPGDDFSSSYMACKLLANQQSGDLYDFDPEYYHIVGSAAWKNIAKATDFRGFLHPYVQTPLWAYSLLPLCENLQFFACKTFFLLLAFACLAATVWLTAFMWAPVFLEKPHWLAALLALVSITTPVRYMGSLVQTHPIFLFASLYAIYLADRARPLLAGLLLAIAASIKITPAIFAVYWLVTRQWKAAAAFFVGLLLLTAAGIYLMGMDVMIAYLANLRRISDVLLVAFNNQSLAAWISDITGASAGNLFNWRMFALPADVKLLSYLSVFASIAIFATVTYKREPATVKALQPYNISLLLLASTMFANIAWSHYYIVLIIPAVVLIARGVEERKIWMLASVGIIFALNFWPLSLNQLAPKIGALTILRSQFWAGMLCLGVLIYKLFSWCNHVEQKIIYNEISNN